MEALKKAQESADAAMKSGTKVSEEQYRKLQREIVQTEQALDDLQKKSKKATGKVSLEDSASASLGSLSEKLGPVQAKAQAANSVLKPLATGILAIGTAAAATVPATEELRTDLSKLDNNARNSGVGIDKAREAFEAFTVVSDETDSSVEATSNLLQAGFTESNLQKAVEGLAGAYLSFPDTLKIESLADSLQETLATGEATGQFAELLDRLGMSTEDFNKKLAAAPDLASKQDVALQALANAGMNDVYEGWKKNNEQMVDSKQAQIDLQQSLAELAKTIEPFITGLTEMAAKLLDWFNSLSPTSKKVIAITGIVIVALAGVTAAVVSFTTAMIALDAALFPVIAIVAAVVAVIGALALAFVAYEENWGGFGDWVNGVGESIKQAWESVVAWFESIPERWNAMWESVGEFFTNIGESIKQFFVGIGEWISQLPEQVAFFLGSMLGKIATFFTEELPLIINSAIEWFSTLPERFSEWLNTTIDNVVQWGTDLWTNITTGVSNAVNSAVEWVSTLPDRFKSWLDETINRVTNWASSIGDRMKESGKNIIEGLWNGITDKWNWLMDKFSSIGDAFMKGFNAEFDINSPSKRMEEETGVYILPGLFNGILKSLPDTLKNISGVTDSLVASMTNGFTDSTSQSALAYAGGGQETSGLTSMLETMFNAFTGHTHPITLNDGTLVSKLSPPINKNLGNSRDANERGQN